MAYITGTHNFKAVSTSTSSARAKRNTTTPSWSTTPSRSTFRNQLPVSVLAIYTGPYGLEQERVENNLYVQDQWTTRRLTLNLGVRYSVYDMTIPAMHLGPGVSCPRAISRK